MSFLNLKKVRWRLAQLRWLCALTAAFSVWGADLDANQVKARYIVNFIKYITWPEDSAGETNGFTIVVHDAANVKTALDDVARGKELHGRPIQTLLATESAGFATGKLIYIRETHREKLGALMTATPKRALTVGEGPGFLARGGMIEFVISDGKVRFNVNLPALREAGFNVDPKLLVAAQEVRK